MPLDAPAFWLICYDIADHRRLQRIHRTLAKQALALQYSVFLAHTTRTRLSALLRQIEELIDPREDDVRAYRLTDPPTGVFMGAAMIPDGVLLMEGPTECARLDTLKRA